MEPQKLVNYALNSTVAHINKGSTPTAALEKVARDLDLNANFIQRTGEALNVSLHFNHFKTAADRASDFATADIPQVTRSIFGEKEASLSEKKAAWFPPVNDVIDYNKILANPMYKKAAVEIRKTDANFDTFGISYKGQYKKASDYISKIEKELDEIRTEKAANDVYLETIFNSLVKDFKKTASARSEFHELETQAFNMHGSRAVPYLDLIYKTANLTEERGAHDSQKLAFDSCPELDKFNSLLKSAARANDLKTELAEAETYVSAARGSFKEAGYKLNGPLQVVEKTACDEMANDIDDILEKTAAGQVTKSLVEQMFEKYRSPNGSKTPAFKNTKADNSERTTMLQELIMTDPILAHQDPKKILSAYQQILRLAPHLAKEKEVVRSLLRQLTATQSLAPVEANQLVEANMNLMKQHQLLHSTQEDKKK